MSDWSVLSEIARSRRRFVLAKRRALAEAEGQTVLLLRRGDSTPAGALPEASVIASAGREAEGGHAVKALSPFTGAVVRCPQGPLRDLRQSYREATSEGERPRKSGEGQGTLAVTPARVLPLRRPAEPAPARPARDFASALLQQVR